MARASAAINVGEYSRIRTARSYKVKLGVPDGEVQNARRNDVGHLARRSARCTRVRVRVYVCACVYFKWRDAAVVAGHCHDGRLGARQMFQAGIRYQGQKREAWTGKLRNGLRVSAPCRARGGHIYQRRRIAIDLLSA